MPRITAPSVGIRGAFRALHIVIRNEAYFCLKLFCMVKLYTVLYCIEVLYYTVSKAPKGLYCIIQYFIHYLSVSSINYMQQYYHKGGKHTFYTTLVLSEEWYCVV